jgi:hypothetical protein
MAKPIIFAILFIIAPLGFPRWQPKPDSLHPKQ